jgi:hypothetical protein
MIHMRLRVGEKTVPEKYQATELGDGLLKEHIYV